MIGSVWRATGKSERAQMAADEPGSLSRKSGLRQVLRISAGNYGGKLVLFHLHLHELLGS